MLTPISRGAMGAVYRARGRATGELVALKRLLDPQYAAQFEIEARLLTRLRHPRVVRVLGHFEEDSGSYLVMELVEGTDLSRVLRERQPRGLPVAEAVEYARQACEALDYIHAQQVVHRDVKPQNLILGDRGIVLADFGVARELAPVTAGTVVGTPRFMAPEILAGSAPSPRSDVFGIAATLWTLLVGAPPSYGTRGRLRKVVPDATPAIESALYEGLELDPARRTPSAAAFARALDASLDEAQGVPLALSLADTTPAAHLLEAIVRTAAGDFGSAAASLALAEPGEGRLVYRAAWGAGADEILGVQLEPGVGIAGAVARDRHAEALADCRADERFAAQVAAGTGYVPHTMLVVPLVRGGRAVGVLSILDRRDGKPYTVDDIPRAELFAELSLAALETEPEGSTIADPA